MSELPVKVYVRVRPLLGKELLQSEEVCLQVVSPDQLLLGQDRPFRFDTVFQPDATQARVYEVCVRPLLTSCLDGYNVTVLAYGQTGSGKSFTMGSEDTLRALASEERRGLIPRSLEELFSCIVSKREEFQYTVKVSYLEIYKEELRDLLWSGCVTGEGPHELHIRETEEGHTAVLGCVEELVESADEALSWLGVGNAARITEATEMNQRSSRSHAVFTIHLKKRRRHLTAQPDQDDHTHAVECVSSKFHFVDLAGSERVSRTGNRGERFKESVHINSGLLALGNVISALSDPRRRGTHVPYRESKITRLLKDSLGGNASTAMITCLSPAAANFAENLNSLKYAKRARKIRNCPVVNRDTQVGKVQRMKEEIILLREELVRAKMEAQQLLASSKSRTILEDVGVGSVATSLGGGSVGVAAAVVGEGSDGEFGGGTVRGVEGLEERLNRCRLRVGSYSQCLRHVREKLVGVLGVVKRPGVEGEGKGGVGRPGVEGEGEGGVGRPGVEGEGAVLGEEAFKVIEDCVNLLVSCEDASSAEQMASSPDLVTGREQETISRLQSELERCRLDLRTDELAFAEKMEEVAELQSTCDLLVREKERAEAMWAAAQESEAELQAQVEELRRRLDCGGGGAMDGSASGEEGGEGEEGEEAEISADSLSGRVGQASLDEQRFEATQSLLRGRVKTDSLECYTEEAVISSLHLLTQCLLDDSLSSPEIEHNQPINLGDTRVICDHHLPLPTIEETAESAGLGKTMPTNRPATPSERGPLQRPASKGGGAYGWGGRGGVSNGGRRSEMELLNESALDSRQQLFRAEEKLGRAEEELRCLTLKIKLKEELIRELGKTSHSAKQQGQTYLRKIQALEEEAGLVREELVRVQGLLQWQEGGGEGGRGQDSEKVIKEHRERLAVTEKKLAALQKKQKDTARLASYGLRSERRIEELESGIERLRNQQESLRRKLKQQSENKTRLENNLQKYQHRIKALQTRSEQQSKVLRVKTEEAAAAQRKLRQLNAAHAGRPLPPPPPAAATQATPPPLTDRGGEVERKRAWLEQEVEKVLKEKQAVAALEKDLEERERIVREKEALVQERDALQLKELQSGQQVAREMERVSVLVSSVDSSLLRCRQEQEGVASGGGEQGVGDFKQLSEERERLVQRYEQLKKTMGGGGGEGLLSTVEQQKLVFLNEQIQVLEAAIEFKTGSILTRKTHVDSILTDSLDQSHVPPQQQDHALLPRDQLSVLSREEVCSLLELYVQKVVDLRAAEGEGRRVQHELEVRVEEEWEGRRRAESVVRQVRLEGERSLLTQQMEHSRHVQLLLAERPSEETVEKLASKVKSLERDLYYYRKTSRDLRKRLQGVGSTSGGGGGAWLEGGAEGARVSAEGARVSAEENQTSSAPECEGKSERERRRVRRRHRAPSGGGVAGGGGAGVKEGRVVIEKVPAISRAGTGQGEGSSAVLPVRQQGGDGATPPRQPHPLESRTAHSAAAGDGRVVVRKQRSELRQLSSADLTKRQKQSNS